MAGSTLPRRAIGRLLRTYRTHAGKSQLSAGLHIEMSPQSIGRLEDGQKVKIVTSQIKDLLDLYELANPSHERAEILALWEEAREQDRAAKLAGTTKGWWRAYSDQFAPHFDHYSSLEAAAVKLTTHQDTLLPGLLQTSEYRRTMIRIAEPELSAVDIERRLELAARRQARLEDDSFRMVVLLSESALRHRPGEPFVMAEQLDHLADLSERRPNVSIRIVPLGVGSHLGLVVQSFSLLEFPSFASRLTEPPIVYIEGHEGALYLEQLDVITRYKRTIADIERVALSENETRQLVQQLAKEHRA